MERRSIVADADPDPVSRIVAEVVDTTHHYDGRSVDVFMSEEYEFWRTNSNLQLTAIVERTADDRSHVELVAGGGGSGLLQWTWGNERSLLETTTDEITQACRSAGIAVDRPA